MILVVGAAAVDLVAARDSFLPGTSNPASIRLSAGGVGYNVFRHLRSPARFLTAVGRDPLSDWLATRLGGDSRVRIRRLDLDAPPLYAAFMERGRLLVGASDLRAAEGIDTAFVAEDAEALGPRDFLVLDANLAPALSAAVCHLYAKVTRVVFEPVSREKAALHAGGLSGLFLATPTEGEAAALASIWLAAPEAAALASIWLAAPEAAALCGGVEKAAWGAVLRERRTAHLIVKRGAGGLTHCRLDGAGIVSCDEFAPAAVSSAADTTGAGDRLLAAILDALHEGSPMGEAVRSAMAAVERWLEGGKT